MSFGQLILGSPGSGKTTYCNGMLQYLKKLGRDAAIVNLDPANDYIPYECAVDVMELVSLEETMKATGLGPNGDGTYLIFDSPGQVELLTLHTSLQMIIKKLTDEWNMRLVAVYLVDSNLLSNPAQYMSALLLSLNTMMWFSLPHVNVLSKMDILNRPSTASEDERLAFGIDYYTEVQDLSYLVSSMNDVRFSTTYKSLSAKLCEVIEDFSLVSFLPLSIQDEENMRLVLASIDKANGYVFTKLKGNIYPPEFLYGAGSLDEDMCKSLQKYEEQYIIKKP